MTHNRKPDVLPVEGASIAEALKACPFCGEDAELEYSEGESPDVYAQCTGCQAQGPATRYGCRDEDDAIDLEAEASELWNKRPAEEMADLCAEAMGSQLLDVQQDAIAKGKELRSALERAAAEGEARALTLRDGDDEAWSLREVLSKLVESADILLHQKDYDGSHWELIQSAWEHGKRYLAAPPKGSTP